MCGVAPVPASSGMTNRHRLAWNGHRQANAALHRTAIVRMQYHQPTIEYVARRSKEGLPRKDIIRCLKRFIAREAYGRQQSSNVATTLESVLGTLELPSRSVSKKPGGLQAARAPAFPLPFHAHILFQDEPGGEVVFGIDVKLLRRSANRLVGELTRSIKRWTNTWNENPRAFKWTKSAEEIFTSMARYLEPLITDRTPDYGH